MKYLLVCAIGLLLLFAAACQKENSQMARTELRNAQGEVVGNATFTQTGDGVKIDLQVSKMTPGLHGVHIHEVGKCEPPAFTTAGGHFNPDSKHHGAKNPQGEHNGDLGNFTVGADGTAKVSLTDKNVTIGPGTKSLFQPNGTSLVIHQGTDDEMSDPAGNSGPRVACGVIKQ